MTDAALAFDPATGDFDLDLAGPDLARNGGLVSAVIVSLFSDRLAGVDDTLPGRDHDRRGWWADAYADELTGSRLWLLSREKLTPAVAQAAESYATEATNWLVGQAGVTSIDIDAAIVNPDRLRLQCVVHSSGLDTGGQPGATERLVIENLDVDIVVNAADIAGVANSN